jgi:hypothetical protein
MRGLAITALAIVAGIAPAAWAASLTPGDTDLGRIKASALTEGLSVSVDLGDDTPSSTHVIARFQNNQPLMLGPDGLWAPWDGNFARIDQTNATIANGKLTFRILDTLPDGLFYPASFTVIYRTGEDLKSGTLTVDAP